MTGTRGMRSPRPCLLLHLLLLGSLDAATGLFHPLRDAHVAAARAHFTVCASADGAFPALLPLRPDSGAAATGSLSVWVNGRSSRLDIQRGQHALVLRQGVNTVAYEHTELLPAGGGLTVRGAVDCVDTNQPGFTTVEAEDGVCTGSLLGPTFIGHTSEVHLATEASGRRACQLKTAADYVEFIATVSYSALAIRFSIPDAPKGGGISSQIRVAVDGAELPPQNISSAHSWVYGNLPCKPPSYCNDPKDGLPSHYYDEVRIDLSKEVKGSSKSLRQPGSRIRLAMVPPPPSPPQQQGQQELLDAPLNCTAVPYEERRDCGFSGVTAAQCVAKGCCWDPHPVPNPDHHPYCFYKPSPPAPPAPFTLTIDLIDLYTVPAPYQPVAGAVSVLDHGADPLGRKDSRDAFQAALRAAAAAAAAAAANAAERTDEAGAGAAAAVGAVWVPAGDYLVLGHIIMPQHGGVSLHGAGPWHSTLRGGQTNPTIVGIHAAAASIGMGLYDIAIIGDVRGRDDQSDVVGVGGTPTGGAVIQNVYIQHTKCGLWINGPGEGLVRLDHIDILCCRTNH